MKGSWGRMELNVHVFHEGLGESLLRRSWKRSSACAKRTSALGPGNSVKSIVRFVCPVASSGSHVDTLHSCIWLQDSRQFAELFQSVSIQLFARWKYELHRARDYATLYPQILESCQFLSRIPATITQVTSEQRNQSTNKQISRLCWDPLKLWTFPFA